MGSGQYTTVPCIFENHHKGTRRLIHDYICFEYVEYVEYVEDVEDVENDEDGEDVDDVE